MAAISSRCPETMRPSTTFSRKAATSRKSTGTTQANVSSWRSSFSRKKALCWSLRAIEPIPP